jgi:hypothetical protein
LPDGLSGLFLCEGLDSKMRGAKMICLSGYFVTLCTHNDGLSLELEPQFPPSYDVTHAHFTVAFSSAVESNLSCCRANYSPPRSFGTFCCDEGVLV